MKINKVFIYILLAGCFVNKFTTLNAETPSFYSSDENKKVWDEINEMRKRDKLPKPEGNDNDIYSAYMQVKLLQLKRIDEKTVISTAGEIKEISKKQLTDIAKSVETLAYASYVKGGEATDKFYLLLDFLSSQGLYNKFPGIAYHNYREVRSIPVHFINAISMCEGDRRGKLIEGIQYMLQWQVVKSGKKAIMDWVNSDYIYNISPYLYLCALYNSDMNKAVEDMNLFSYFLSVSSEYTRGGNDILKPDGTGFHHKCHYNAYMFAYKTWVNYLYKLKGTSFRVSQDGYERLAKAVVSEYLMAVRSNNDKNRLFANSMAGRHPFSGMKVTFNKEDFEKLIEIGGDVKGRKIDERLAAYFNAFYMTEEYKDVEPVTIDGFYQFNYSPAGVYRKDNWVATMKCPTKKFLGSEIYEKTNRFGRYQGHGTLEVVYEGGLTETGYPTNESEKWAGWDWNVVPGTTTVHYTDWVEMMPNKNNKDRFDQWAATTSFAGALSAGEYGLFSAEFDQSDTWGNPRYTPTNLTFRKSVLAIDGMLFSVGNSISSIGKYPDWITATNLFQSVINKKNKQLIVNGEDIKSGSSLIIPEEKAAWIINPVGTGYYIPSGHDELVIDYKKQETPSGMGTEAPMGELLVAKAYINHGVKPKAGSYKFLVLPAVDLKNIENIALDYNNKKLFDIVELTDSTHILKYIPKNVIAYSLFKPAKELNTGVVLSSETELLILERKVDDGILLSFCNPNLRPFDIRDRDWTAAKTMVKIVLKGKWTSNEVEGVKIEYDKSGNTVISTVLRDGNKIDLELK